MSLMHQARRFWYNNLPGPFEWGGYHFERRDMWIHGGPAWALSMCEKCQLMEWASRVQGKNLFISHTCAVAERCEELCAMQGDDAWTHYHMDHWFAVDIDHNLNAPKCALLFQEEIKGKRHRWYWHRYPDQHMINFRRQLAQACQVGYEGIDTADWSQYDFAVLPNAATTRLVERPPLPLIMTIHDYHHGDAQAILDHYQPEVLLTPTPTPVKAKLCISDNTQVIFFPQAVAPYFVRTNLNEPKAWDLLSIGSLKGKCYQDRVKLNDQLKELHGFDVGFSNRAGAARAYYDGPLGDDALYLNKWMDTLGQARFVIFGPARRGEEPGAMVAKYYECLASGAVPIMPEIEDLRLLGVKPMVHYIPLSVVQGDNVELAYYLRNYKDHVHTARRAVSHYKARVNEWLFGGLESAVELVTDGKYPVRVIE